MVLDQEPGASFPLPNSLGLRAWPRQNTSLASLSDLLEQVTMVIHFEWNVVLAETMMLNDDCWQCCGFLGLFPKCETTTVSLT